MPRAKRLVVGLGNPGAEYEETRHNIGFAVMDAVAAEAGVSFSHERGNVLLGWGSHRGSPFGLAKPLTYMNRSGSAVKTLLGRFDIGIEDLLVVYDDINLDPGRLRMRPQGSAGGHNGLQDIIDRLGTNAFPRLRFGVGSDFSRGRQVDYVLSPFSKAELPIVEEGIVRAREAVLAFVKDGLHTAMNRYN